MIIHYYPCLSTTINHDYPLLSLISWLFTTIYIHLPLLTIAFPIFPSQRRWNLRHWLRQGRSSLRNGGGLRRARTGGGFRGRRRRHARRHFHGLQHLSFGWASDLLETFRRKPSLSALNVSVLVDILCLFNRSHGSFSSYLFEKVQPHKNISISGLFT